MVRYDSKVAHLRYFNITIIDVKDLCHVISKTLNQPHSGIIIMHNEERNVNCKLICGTILKARKLLGAFVFCLLYMMTVLFLVVRIL